MRRRRQVDRGQCPAGRHRVAAAVAAAGAAGKGSESAHRPARNPHRRSGRGAGRPGLQDDRRSVRRPNQLRQGCIRCAHSRDPFAQCLQGSARASRNDRLPQGQDARAGDRGGGRRYRGHQQTAGRGYRRHPCQPRPPATAAADRLPGANVQRRGRRQEQAR